jgi:predicted PurR-regulated permease PerM
MLYLARVVFVPLSLALLFSVVLTPPVSFLEKMKLPRILAIFLVVLILAGGLGLLGWSTSQQFLDFATQLPAYKKTLQEKIHVLRWFSNHNLNKASDTVRELEKEIGSVAPGSSAANTTSKAPPVPGSSPSRPLAVEVVSPPNSLESVENLFGPLATSALVIIFTVFILAGREDLRNRLIRLAGGGRLNLMTQALDEAAQGAVAVQLTLGTWDTWCAVGVPRYPASTFDRPGRFTAQMKTPPPATCPAP